MRTIKIQNSGISKTREKEIGWLYATIFKNKSFPDNADMRAYENLKMINADELIKNESAEKK